MDSKKLGNRIRKIRASKKLTQQVLAEKIGRDSKYISEIERGVKKPSLPTFVDILQGLETTPNEMLCDFIDIENNLTTEIMEYISEMDDSEKTALLLFLKEFEIHARDK